MVEVLIEAGADFDQADEVRNIIENIYMFIICIFYVCASSALCLCGFYTAHKKTYLHSSMTPKWPSS